MKTYQVIARKLNSISNCIASGNAEWQAKHEESLENILKTAPSGSGIDSGTKFSLHDNLRNPSKLVFTAGFHHMNDGGYYDGWTHHVLTVTPNLGYEYNLKISGRGRNQIKVYLQAVYSAWLDSECKEFSTVKPQSISAVA